MEKQTKNIITREFIEKELRFYNGADIKSAVVLLGVLSLLFVPITIGTAHVILSLVKNIALKIALLIVVCGLTSAPIWLNLSGLFVSISNRKLLARGEFDIVTRDVQYKSEKMVHRHMEEYLHFQDFGAVWAGHTTYQITSNGDVFYIVHYKTKNKAEMIYSTKMYEYK